MFLTVNEFTNALKNKSYYDKKLQDEQVRFSKILDDWDKSKKAIDDEQYNRIRTSLNYETITNEKGETEKVLKQRSTNSISQVELMEIYDERREKTNNYYRAKLNRSNEIISDCRNKICEIERVYKKLSREIQFACSAIFYQKRSYQEVAKEMNISSSTLYRNIQKEIDRVIDEVYTNRNIRNMKTIGKINKQGYTVLPKSEDWKY